MHPAIKRDDTSKAQYMQKNWANNKKDFFMETLEITKAKETKTTTENISGSEAVLKALIAEDVKTIFGYPGGAIMPIYDALFDYEDKIEHILVRHEQGAIHAAQ